MKKITASITECTASDCAYNKHNSCHTLAITVGGPEECPHCDTYTVFALKGGIDDIRGDVGACKVSRCTFNEDMECGASRIKVGWHMDHAECVSFKDKNA